MIEDFLEKGHIDRTTYAELRDIFGTDYEVLVQEFVEKIPSSIESLRTAISVSEPSTIVNLCHSMKGMASNLGFSTLATRCEALEIAARTGQSSAFQTLFEHLNSLVAKMR